MQEINNTNNNLKLAALSYLFITCLIPLILGKDEFIKFHSRQGFVLSNIQIFVIFLMSIPVFGWILGIIVILITVLAIRSSLSGGKWKIPYIYNLSLKIKIK